MLNEIGSIQKIRDRQPAQMADVEHRFTYHAPKPEQIPLYNDLRESARILAMKVIVTCPESRERSLSLTKIEEAVMWANAAIAGEK